MVNVKIGHVSTEFERRCGVCRDWSARSTCFVFPDVNLSMSIRHRHGFLDAEDSILSTASFNGEPTRSKQSARLTETTGLSRRNLQRHFASDWVIELILYDTIDMDTGKADFAAQCRHMEMLVDTDVGGHTSPTYSSTSFSVR